MHMKRATALCLLEIDVGNCQGAFAGLQARDKRRESENAIADPIRRCGATRFTDETAAERVGRLVAGMNFDVIEAGHPKDVRGREIVAHDGAEMRRALNDERIFAGRNRVRLALRAVHARFERVALENAIDIEHARR